VTTTTAPDPGRPQPSQPAAPDVLVQGAVDLITLDELRAKLGRGEPLRVKLGIDPTAADIHLGFAVVLRMLRRFQDAGHVAVLIVGDFTAQVGDPSGRSATRPRLGEAEVDRHAQTYLEQVQRILSGERLEVRRNSEWLAELGVEGILRLTSGTTVAQMLQRNDFATRYAEGSPISITEFLYPLFQGYDSVMVRADVELGGTDQLFNLLVGRDLQAAAGQEPQVVLTTPLLEGLAGGAKMSKSLGNAVGIAEPPGEQFGKLMSIPDALLDSYLRHATGWDGARSAEVTGALAAGTLHPNEAKRLLARTVCDLYHGAGAGATAEAEFDRVFREHAPPSDPPEFLLAPDQLEPDGTIRLSRLLVAAGLAGSLREARRKLDEGAVRLDGAPLTGDPALGPGELAGRLLSLGRRRWARIAWPAGFSA
jgi:tyrosyl-tRNA synthetase